MKNKTAMSDTPETDNFNPGCFPPSRELWICFARRLELERNEARNAYQCLKKAAEMYFLIEDISDESGYVCCDMPTLDEAYDDLMKLIHDSDTTTA